MRVADEVGLAVSGPIKLDRVVAPGSVWSRSDVVLASLDLANTFFGVVIKRVVVQVDDSGDDLDFVEIGLEALEADLVEEL